MHDRQAFSLQNKLVNNKSKTRLNVGGRIFRKTMKSRNFYLSLGLRSKTYLGTLMKNLNYTEIIFTAQTIYFADTKLN